VNAHHRFMLGEHLKQIENLDAAIRRVSQQINDRFGAPDADASTQKPSCPEPKEERTEPVKQTRASASSCTSSQVVGHDAIIEQVSTTDKRQAGAQQMQVHRDEDVQRAIQATATLACCKATEPLSWSKAIELLRALPGISERAAQGILAEIGLDMVRRIGGRQGVQQELLGLLEKPMRTYLIPAQAA